ncbi:MAG: chemotaxis protein CheW [Candidatus Heimdallarchaeota archaeon]|nr:chemotaxis protein CheW [Candidatus Heimdallarchaeota archaeon]
MATSQLEEKKFVAFRLGPEFYSIDVHRVQEVFIPSSITEIPQTKAFVAGVINFRGVIVTVINLKDRLGITDGGKKVDGDREDEDDRLYVIIVNFGDATIGLLVDYVEAVISISDDVIQSSFDLISDEAKTTFLSGIARTDLGLTVILALDTILSEYDITEIEKLTKLREEMRRAEGGTEELVITSEELVDFAKDDLTDADADKFRKVQVSGSSEEIGSAPLDLNSLTKAELLKIAVEMEILEVSTRSSKNKLVEKIKEKMGG